MRQILESVWQLAEPIVAAAGLELWDVEYVKEAGAWFLRVYLDSEQGVTIEDCEQISRALDPALDTLNVLIDSYTFEVSSAGAERKLKRESDFLRFIGHLIEVRLYRQILGAKEHIGTLQTYDSGNVTIETDGETRTFQKSDIALVRLRIG